MSYNNQNEVLDEVLIAELDEEVDKDEDDEEENNENETLNPEEINEPEEFGGFDKEFKDKNY